MTLFDYIESHPGIAFIVGGTHIALAETLKHAEIPTIIMQCFQIGAWTVTIIVGLYSLRGMLKKKKDG